MQSRGVALITGAAQGIGRRIAEPLAARGYSLALNDVRAPTAALESVRESGFINGQAIAVDGGWTADGSWQSLRLRHR